MEEVIAKNPAQPEYNQAVQEFIYHVAYGGGKGGSDFDPKGKKRCRSNAFLPELYCHIVLNTNASERNSKLA